MNMESCLIIALKLLVIHRDCFLIVTTKPEVVVVYQRYGSSLKVKLKLGG